MATPDLLLLIDKYLKHTILEDELTTLKKLLENEENAKIFKNLVKDNYQLKTKNADFNAKELFAKIEPKLEQTTPKKVIRFKPFYKYAAVASVLLIVALTIFLNKEDNQPQFIDPIIVNNQIKTGLDKATLTLASGEEVTLIKGTSFQTQNASSNGEEITYNNNTSRELVYNYLTIPRGGQFQLTLADGTQVWLNSETQLKYPVSFTGGESRQVELIYGEAYFDVSPSTAHHGASFKVFNNAQEIEVLGTEFNIKAYKDETNIYTTLVEGKVAVRTANANKILIPNQQSKVNTEGGEITVSVVNVSNIISWKDGIFDFKDKPLKDIMKVLSRWYDMDVEFENKELEQEHFNGRINKQHTIEDILASFKNTDIINTYEVNSKTVILK